MANTIAPEQIQQFATGWFHALDVHVPLQECLSMLSKDGLHMHFPDGDIGDSAAFGKWYERVTHLFFDEQHTILTIEVVKDAADRTDLQLLVRWHSGWWEAPAA